MKVYSQTDPKWADKELGKSGLTMRHFGCVVTDVAQALTLAGYDVDPGVLVDHLNNVGGFTPDGLLIWTKVSEVYPQFKFGQPGYRFVRGSWGRYLHWLLQDMTTGKTYDPFYGKENAPVGFVEQQYSRVASIEPAHLPPVEEPEQPSEPQQPGEPFRYTVKQGDTLWAIVKRHYALEDVHEIANKIKEVADANEIANPDLIHPDDVLVLP